MKLFETYSTGLSIIFVAKEVRINVVSHRVTLAGVELSLNVFKCFHEPVLYSCFRYRADALGRKYKLASHMVAAVPYEMLYTPPRRVR